MTRTEAKRLEAAKTLAEAHEMADRFLANERRKSARRSSRSPRAAPSTKPQRKSADEARQRRVYRAVDARSGGACEFGASTFCLNDATEHDHFWGRGRDESVESVWHLCKFHHDRKTANDPSRVQWLRWFRDHCFRNDYREQMEKCDRAISLETAQHPEHRCRFGALVCTHAQCQGETTP